MQNKKFLGKQLKRNLFSKAGILIASPMTVLDQVNMRILDRHEITLTEADVQDTEIPIKKHIDISTEQIKEIFQEIRFTKKIPLLAIRRQTLEKIHQAIEEQIYLGYLQHCSPRMIIPTDIILV